MSVQTQTASGPQALSPRSRPHSWVVRWKKILLYLRGEASWWKNIDWEMDYIEESLFVFLIKPIKEKEPEKIQRILIWKAYAWEKRTAISPHWKRNKSTLGFKYYINPSSSLKHVRGMDNIFVLAYALLTPGPSHLFKRHDRQLLFIHLTSVPMPLWVLGMRVCLECIHITHSKYLTVEVR